MVIGFGEQLHFFRTGLFEYGIINDQDVYPVFTGQVFDGITNDSGGQYCGETNPVDMEGIHQTIHGIFLNPCILFAHHHIHVHGTVGKNHAEEIAENINDRKSL